MDECAFHLVYRNRKTNVHTLYYIAYDINKYMNILTLIYYLTRKNCRMFWLIN